ncbi:hypothetical protein AVEN_190848-1 [Araneus ventricosus]|uniref:RNA-directed DNA polymerase from mobile element jockey n=1 Tax=Araneus ventricosus TaxID=182803 RepID=A0A4Y2RP89_ARAVE|nr:hypothetical protein AVEN_190848-1 [Araneus ventricosus]
MPILNPIQLFGQPIPFVSEYKYLGLILDAKLNSDSHIQKAVTQAKNSSFALRRLIAPKSTLAIKHKLLLYKAIVQPVMLYSSPIWGTTSIRNLRKLQVFQNQQLARIVNAPWYVRRKLIHQDIKIDPVLDFMKIISEKLPQIPKALLQLPPYDPAIPSSRKRPRSMLDCTYENFPTIKRRRDVITIAESLDP